MQLELTFKNRTALQINPHKPKALLNDGITITKLNIFIKADCINTKTNTMENKNLGSKKRNNKQNTSEELDPENTPENHDSIAPKLVAEVEINSSGEQKVVHRARNIDSKQNNNEENESPSSSLEIFSDKETQRMVENKDHNSDITAHRYPNSDPDNHKDRGNIKLDE